MQNTYDDDEPVVSASRAWTLAGHLALGMATVTGCTTPWGDLGGVDEGGSPSGPEEPDEPGASTGDGLGGSESGLVTTGDAPGAPNACERLGLTLDAAPSPPRSLTRAQYSNTVRDLFGVEDGIWSDPTEAPWTFAADPRRSFDTMTPIPEVVAGYSSLATLVAQAVEPATLLPCAVDDPDPAACAAVFVPQLGRAVWRRPLTPDEVTAMMANFDGANLVDGTRALVQSMLSSPEFYVLREQGIATDDDPGLLRLDDYSLATRMSYFLWNSTPDALLLDRAALGELADASGRAEEVQRMLADPRASSTVGEMYAQWMGAAGLEGLTKDDPEFTETLAAAMQAELRMLASDIVLGSGDGRLGSMLTAPYTFVNDELLALYGDDAVGVAGAPGPESFVRAELDPARRGGLLTLPGLMARYSEPDRLSLIQRGLWLRQQWLCQEIPPPPPDVNMSSFEELHRYEAMEEIFAVPECAACHRFTSGLEFAFDTYDELGRWQTTIDGVPVRTDGELIVADPDDVSFETRADFAEKLAGLDTTRQCVASKHFRFALRRLEEGEDECSIQLLSERMAQTDGDLVDLIETVVTNETFTVVRPE